MIKNIDGKILIICGPSGVGKSTIVKLIKHKNKSIKIIPTITTRKPRISDEKIQYFEFISKKKFQNLSSRNCFLEKNLYDNNYYGTLKDDFMEIVKNRELALKEQDIITAKQIKKIFPNNVIIIFITSTLLEIKKRLILRHENSSADIEKRLKIAKTELTNTKYADCIIENPKNHPEIAVNTILKIINIISKQLK